MCKAPSCGESTMGGQVDHHHRFDHAHPERGGWTVESNLDGYGDVRDHRLKTLAEHGLNRWRVTRLPGRRLRWTTPTGQSVVTEPEGDKYLFPHVGDPPPICRR